MTMLTCILPIMPSLMNSVLKKTSVNELRNIVSRKVETQNFVLMRVSQSENEPVQELKDGVC